MLLRNVMTQKLLKYFKIVFRNIGKMAIKMTKSIEYITIMLQSRIKYTEYMIPMFQNITL